MLNRDDPARLGVIIYDGVEPIAATIGVVSMVARAFRRQSRRSRSRNATGPVALAGGLTVVARRSFADAPPCD